MNKSCIPAFVVTLVFVASFAQGSENQHRTAPNQQSGDSQSAGADAIAEDIAVTRTRRQIMMLDDIYKGGIVLITKHYIDGDEDLPAGTAFKKLFEAAKQKGWHEVRLVDATGQPYNDENTAQSKFEKDAIKLLKTGKPFVDKTIIKNNKRYLLAATPIPVVMEKCTMCHSNYDANEKGLVVGALTYQVPIDE